MIRKTLSACRRPIGVIAALLCVCFLFPNQGVFALDPRGDLKQFGHQVWQAEQGLPRNTVTAVLQTRDGYIWLATEAGLTRFDGIDFTVFDKQNTPQFKSNYVRALFEDRDGNLWVSTTDGLIRERNGQFRSFTINDGLPSNNARSVYQ